MICSILLWCQGRLQRSHVEGMSSFSGQRPWGPGWLFFGKGWSWVKIVQSCHIVVSCSHSWCTKMYSIIIHVGGPRLEVWIKNARSKWLIISDSPYIPRLLGQVSSSSGRVFGTSICRRWMWPGSSRAIPMDGKETKLHQSQQQSLDYPPGN